MTFKTHKQRKKVMSRLSPRKKILVGTLLAFEPFEQFTTPVGIVLLTDGIKENGRRKRK